jgi:hypothetical protein
MGDLIGKLLNDPWVVTLVAWVVRLFLICVLAGLVQVIYRLTIFPFIRFPYAPMKVEPGVRGWLKGAGLRLKRVKLGVPGVESEWEALPERVEPELLSALKKKDAIIKEQGKELEKYRSLMAEMRKRLGGYE